MSTDAPRIQNQRRSNSTAPPQGSSANKDSRKDTHDLHKKKEIHPGSSYRRNVNELPSDVPIAPMVAESLSDEVHSSATTVLTFYKSNTGQLLAYRPEGSIQQKYQAFNMSSPGAQLAGPAIVQYTGQCRDQSQQHYASSKKVIVQEATGDMSAYQINSPTSRLPQGVVMAGSPSSLYSPKQLAEEASRKREFRLMKNREAAKQCRRRKKEYVRCLEVRLAMLEVQNKKLINELELLKQMHSANAFS